MLIVGCTSSPVRIYNTIDIPDSVLKPISSENKPMVVNNKTNIGNILYDYKNTYYALQVCNARIDYIRGYIYKYNDKLIN